MLTLIFLMLKIVINQVYCCTVAPPTLPLVPPPGDVSFSIQMNGQRIAIMDSTYIDEDPLKNVNFYVLHLRQIFRTVKYDLIVFPEYSFTPTTSYPSRIKVGERPCTNPHYPPYVRRISCSAHLFNSTLVVNLIELARLHLHNTNVVLNGAGQIQATYRKYNLHGENGVVPPSRPEVRTFTVASALQFGLLTCFDILNAAPAHSLVHVTRNVILTSYWYSELPFLTALQVQQMFAHAHNVTLVAAGGYTGSGFHWTASRMRYYPYQRQVVGSIDTLARQMDTFDTWTEDLTNYTTIQMIPNADDEFERILCHMDNLICCRFWIRIAKPNPIESHDLNHYRYRLMAYSGPRTFSNGTIRAQIDVCAVVVCTNHTLESCGRRFDNYDTVKWPLTFTQLRIESLLRHNLLIHQHMHYPNSVLASLRPIDSNHLVWETNRSDSIWIRTRFELKYSQNRLLTFSIYGRTFKTTKSHKIT